MSNPWSHAQHPPMYNISTSLHILFSSLDLFARIILIASFSLKGSSYCNHSHPCHQVKMTLPNMISAIPLSTDTGWNQQTGNNNGAWTEPIKHVYRSTLHCQLYPQLWDGHPPLVSKPEMNEWLSAHGIGKRVPAVSGGTLPSRKF